MANRRSTVPGPPGTTGGDERERHDFRCAGDEDLVFVEFFVPGEYRTVWVEGAAVCAWVPAGRNIMGGKPAREI